MEVIRMYKIIKDKCPSGYAYAVDYLGNKCYFGPVNECKKFIAYMEREYKKIRGIKR